MVSGISGNQQRPPQGVDPNQYAQQYANSKGISLEEAKSELKAMHGDPAQQSSNIFEQSGTNSGSTGEVALENNSAKANFDAQLEQLGIPADIVAQGKEAVEQYAKENNIQLPPPPEQNQAGQSLNILS